MLSFCAAFNEKKSTFEFSWMHFPKPLSALIVPLLQVPRYRWIRSENKKKIPLKKPSLPLKY
jgi:hypothetical protein